MRSKGDIELIQIEALAVEVAGKFKLLPRTEALVGSRVAGLPETPGEDVA